MISALLAATLTPFAVIYLLRKLMGQAYEDAKQILIDDGLTTQSYIDVAQAELDRLYDADVAAEQAAASTS